MTDQVPTPRCCDSHTNWNDLVQHLVAAFPRVDPGEVVDIVARARRAEEEFGLPDEQRLETAEVIARHQLIQLTALDAPAPRLEPEHHDRRSNTV